MTEYVRVPREPTEAMLVNGREALLPLVRLDNYGPLFGLWQDMLAASPPQPDALPGDMREKIEVVEEWLSLVDTFTAQNYSRVRHVPICQGEIDALVTILSLIQSERAGV